MTIEWNKVTWYSKAAAVVLFVATFFLGFWFGTTKAGVVYVEVPFSKQAKNFSDSSNVATATSSLQTYGPKTFTSGTTSMDYHFQYNALKYRVVSEPTGFSVLRINDNKKALDVIFSPEEGRGYSANEYLENVIARDARFCKDAPPHPSLLSVSSRYLMNNSAIMCDGEYSIAFGDNRSQWLVIATFFDTDDADLDSILETLVGPVL